MNIYESLLAKAINGGGSGNPNSMQTINATLENPWGTNELASQYMTAYANGDVDAVLEFDATALGFGVLNNPIDTSTIEGCSVDGVSSLAYSISFSYASDTAGDLLGAFVVQNGNITDVYQYANLVPSTLTIFWHPMP